MQKVQVNLNKIMCRVSAKPWFVYKSMNFSKDTSRQSHVVAEVSLDCFYFLFPECLRQFPSDVENIRPKTNAVGVCKYHRKCFKTLN